ncbi:UNVERIFIED_CONTAM: Pyrophosphate--fructose 6-phosphate 1-phosphotransferase subunit beta [Sesamum calycinum]|uniref:Pyrophosphate--fructose 6-phosphate 1-phosphotransferase subunit beta n=1 Tax=Sesamum calycinum TaxID=2727403 RepID=A0AAW2Q650_9LAMI
MWMIVMGVVADEIAKLFPRLFGQPSANLVPADSSDNLPGRGLKIGVVLSGGQAPGGHNVISGIFGSLQRSTLYGFRGGPAGIMKCKYVVLTPEYIYPYRNQGGFDMICSGRDKIETPEQVGNLAAPVAEWTVGGTALTSLMDVERRHGKFKPVIKKAMVELEGAPFRKFISTREDWALNNRYLNPGPIQFVGPTSNKVNHTLLLELGAEA